MRPRAAVLLAAVFGVCGAAWARTALEHLRSLPKPRFRDGHRLPPLTRWGWEMPFEVKVELAENWGYALELGVANARLVERLGDPTSEPARLCALAAGNPRRYPLSAMVYRACLDKNFVAALPTETWCRDRDGDFILLRGRKVWSPEAPDAVFQKAAALAVRYLKKVQEKAPLAIILNGGEYALSVYGHHGKVWEQDPRVVEAKGNRSWFDYISERKAHQERIISDAIRAACPNRLLYIYYPTEGCPHRNRYKGWEVWAIDYRHLKVVSDLPSGSQYYMHFNSGWTGENDLLTQTLNAVAQQIAERRPLSYNWVCGGWTRPRLGEKAFSDLPRYVGYLKCYYVAGMIGGIAGYFSYPKGGFKGDVGEEMPHWLGQMVALARVHAFFSHLEEFVRGSDLRPGPLRHRWSHDLPAYEFPTGEPGVRVLARRHRLRPEWLIVAWAADGQEREARVGLPDLGEVVLRARPCGSVYRARLVEGKAQLDLLDKDGERPSLALADRVSPTRIWRPTMRGDRLKAELQTTARQARRWRHRPEAHSWRATVSGLGSPPRLR